MRPTRIFLAILILSVTVLFSYSSIAQKSATTIVNSEQLFNLFVDQESNSMRTPFCHDITVTIDLPFIEIETTITICCSEEIYGCIPVPGTRVKNDKNEYPNDLEISNSSTVTQGRYRISIVDGKYDLNKKGEIVNLMYKVTEI